MTSNKRISCLTLAAVLSWASFAQETTPRILQFTPNVIEIGTVRYDGGPVTVTFEGENICSKPVTILDVRPQCGCTVPSFSRKEVRPGEKARITVTFDPSGTYGEQKRYLTVIATNGDYRKFNTLEVHGQVERDQTEAEIRFPALLGEGIRTELETVGLRKRKAGETVTRTLVLYNDSPEKVKLSWKGSRRMRGTLESKVLEPGARTSLVLTYRTKGLRSGDFSDELVIRANGKALKPVVLKGTIE